MTTGDPAVSDAREVRLRDGATVVLRPIRSADEPLLAVFHAGLSPRSVYQRYFHLTSFEQRTSHQRLAITCRVDPEEGAALVAEQRTDEGTLQILALGRIRRTEPRERAEIAVLVGDRFQGLGLGTAMTWALVEVARALGVRHLYGDMFADNEAMCAVVRRCGFVIAPTPGDARVLRAERELD